MSTEQDGKEQKIVDFKVHAECDVLDEENNWLAAVITAVEEGKMHIHYKGFSSKYDEWIVTSSSRIAPSGTKAPPKTQSFSSGYGYSYETWFSRLFGFSEPSYGEVKAQLQLEVDPDAKQPGSYLLRSLKNQQAYKVGRFATPSLAELRARVQDAKLPEQYSGRLTLDFAYGDVAELHAASANQHATFQAASQFNCLEFVGPSVTPERGVTGYVGDKTQGPCCSVAAGPATVFRNYYAPVRPSPNGGTCVPDYPILQPTQSNIQIGQTADCQINNLLELNAALGNVPNGTFFQVVGGYTMAKDSGLAAMNQRLSSLDEKGRESLRALLRIGVHSDVQVTSSNWGNTSQVAENRIVTQVFGSAASVSYSHNRNGQQVWAPIASLILDASYEACLLAALENAARHGGAAGSKKVFLTALGGGVFGNSMEWIANAIARACAKLQHVDLEVYVVSYSRRVDRHLADIVARFPSR